MEVAGYRLEPYRQRAEKTLYSRAGKKVTVGGYTKHSKRYRTAVQGEALKIATHFVPKQRYWWEGGGITVPDAKLFLPRN